MSQRLWTWYSININIDIIQLILSTNYCIRTPHTPMIVPVPHPSIIHHPSSHLLLHTTLAVVTTTDRHRALPNAQMLVPLLPVQHDRDPLHKSTRFKSNSHICYCVSLAQPGPRLGSCPLRATPPAPCLTRHHRSPAHPPSPRARFGRCRCTRLTSTSYTQTYIGFTTVMSQRAIQLQISCFPQFPPPISPSHPQSQPSRPVPTSTT